MFKSLSTKTYILSHKIELKAITARKHKVKKRDSVDADYAAQSGPLFPILTAHSLGSKKPGQNSSPLPNQSQGH